MMYSLHERTRHGSLATMPLHAFGPGCGIAKGVGKQERLCTVHQVHVKEPSGGQNQYSASRN